MKIFKLFTSLIILMWCSSLNSETTNKDDFVGIWQYPNRAVWIQIASGGDVYQCRVDADGTVYSSAGTINGNVIIWERIWERDVVRRIGDTIYLKGKYGEFGYILTPDKMGKECKNPLKQ